ncbi:MAG: hypothetical protein ACR5KV_00485 [Wolbachia sp.]
MGSNSYRAELEGMYSFVKVDNVGLVSSQTAVSYIKTAKKNSDQTDAKYLYHTVVDHDQIRNASLMANVYHHGRMIIFLFLPTLVLGLVEHE